jgi:hypothetical protein
MYKIQKTSNSNDMCKFIRLDYVFCNLGTVLLSCLLILTAITMKSVSAADNAQKNMILSNQINQVFYGENSHKSSIYPANEKSHITLGERLLTSRKSNKAVKLHTSKSEDLAVKIELDKIRNSSVANLVFSSKNVLNSKINTSQILLTSNHDNIDGESPEEIPQPTNLVNLLSQKKPELSTEVEVSSPEEDIPSDSDTLRQQLLIDPIIKTQESIIKTEPRRAFPGSTAGTPSGYGASGGQVYVGVGLLFPLEEDSDGFPDGSYSAGFGLGDPFKSLGLEVNVNFASSGGTYFNGGEFDVGTSGYMGLKLHKYLRDRTSVAVGWSNALKWGESSDNKDTIYGVVTRAFVLQPDNPHHQLPLTISVGFGNGGFRSLGARAAGGNNANIFGSLGLRVIPEASLVSSWTGNRLNIGTSIAPFRNRPILINALLTDISRNFDTGLGFALSAGYSFKF